ncbi:Na/Pi cotransporter family protein [Pukyongiella litopenaei]|uniref:Na/Pi cotransporter family protein n=1 Tax=Pukyongiella litopenaei TaxID=2605946 RepID=A0A2S0MPH0_9RHOB|nr:Na/Pi cotransporter family protein [Pukyongiella litopenaei]AVO37641.1 Na/Pi cotransporter family protein [Pukyongiella litopenaei]
MAVLSFLVHLAGATLFLLFGVRLVRTGIERAFGARFRRLLTRSATAPRAAGTGFGLAVLLQSSAAVALLAAGFVANGTVSFALAMAAVLGADLGSAFIVQVLSFRVDWLVPVLLTLGGALFLNADRKRLRQAGRIVLGVAIILISLRFLRETMDPIRDSAFLPAIAGYLERDVITAYIVGAALAFVMHSSVAAILMCVTLVSVGALPVEAGVSLVIGANLGSALVPVWLSRGMAPAARRVPLANLGLRGTWTMLVLLLVNLLPVLPWIASAQPGQTLVNTHLALNAALLLAVPLTRWLAAPMAAILPDPADARPDADPEHRSVLDDAMLDNPMLALTSLRREVLRMVQLVERMCEPVMELYTQIDEPRAEAVIHEDRHVNAALDGVRQYVSRLPMAEMSRDQRRQVRELAEYAISIESAGDTVVKRLVPRALQKARDGVKLSAAGMAELRQMHENVMANFHLAANVLVSEDLESARLLLVEKTEMTGRERRSRKKHLKRLSRGETLSLDSSNVHLETLMALKDLNSQVASIAYPILVRHGQLLETRLITELKRVGED